MNRLSEFKLKFKLTEYKSVCVNCEKYRCYSGYKKINYNGDYDRVCDNWEKKK